MDKIELIKKITEYHPASEVGRKYGLSEYTGGMADTGRWYYHKLLDMSEANLQDILDRLIEEWKPVPRPPEKEVIQELEQWFKDRGINPFS